MSEDHSSSAKEADTHREAETAVVAPPHEWFDGLVRIENLIHIEGATSQGDSLPDVFTEFCEALPEKADAPLYAECPVMAAYVRGEEWPEPAEVAEVLGMRRIKGFFVQAAQPVITAFYKSGGYSYSWGCYHTEWLYAATAADIDRVCAEWSDKTLGDDRAKAVSS